MKRVKIWNRVGGELNVLGQQIGTVDGKIMTVTDEELDSLRPLLLRNIISIQDLGEVEIEVAPEPVPEPESVPEHVTEPTPEPVPELVPEPVTEPTPVPVPEPTEED